MDREHLITLRKKVWEKWHERTALGEFDTNSEIICFGLASTLEIIDHLLEEQKGVHQKIKPKTD